MVCLEILGNDELGERVSARAAAARESELGWFHEQELGGERSVPVWLCQRQNARYIANKQREE